MTDKGMLILTVYVCLLGMVAGFAIGDGVHRYSGVDDLFFGEDRIQWEILLTSFAALLVAWRMYSAERNKTHSMASATIITASGPVSAVKSFATHPLVLKDNIDEVLDAINIAAATVQQAILTCNDRRIVPSLNNIQAAILNLRSRARGVQVTAREKVNMDRVEGISAQSKELDERIDELIELVW